MSSFMRKKGCKGFIPLLRVSFSLLTKHTSKMKCIYGLVISIPMGYPGSGEVLCSILVAWFSPAYKLRVSNPRVVFQLEHSSCWTKKGATKSFEAFFSPRPRKIGALNGFPIHPIDSGQTEILIGRRLTGLKGVKKVSTSFPRFETNKFFEIEKKIESTLTSSSSSSTSTSHLSPSSRDNELPDRLQLLLEFSGKGFEIFTQWLGS